MKIVLHHIEGAEIEPFDYAVNGQVLDIYYHDVVYRFDFTNLGDGVLLNPPDFEGSHPLIWAQKYQGDLTVGLMSLSEDDVLDEPFDAEDSKLSETFEMVLIEWSEDESKDMVMTEIEILKQEFEDYKKDTENRIKTLENRLYNLEHALDGEHDIEIEE